ncbi:MAG TPA: hypothetical protein PKD45_10100 [Flavobacteriales bacterium]|nr:hypothetical protein [Flavobacteriales bacterium]
MKKKLFPTMALLALLGTACSPVEAPHDDHAHDPAVESHEQHGDETGHAVQLDNGKTWEANAETTQGIEAMASIAAGYDAATGDGVVLKEELMAEFQEIFAKCTMTGEAHEQLHNYLLPLKGMLDGLGDEPTAEQLAALRDYLGSYGNFFH